ncbi:oligosaccharide flippase family protein [Fibrobacterota bacterium]
MSSFRQTFLLSSKWIASFSILQNMIGFLFGIILARLLSPEIFGEFAIQLALVEMLTVITGIGINTSIIQNRKYDDEIFNQVGFTLSLWFLFIYNVLAVVFGIIFFRDKLQLFLLILLSKSIFMVCGVHSCLLRKSFRFKLTSFLDFFAHFCAIVLAIFSAFLGFGIYSLVIQFGLSQVIISFGTLYFSNFRPKLTLKMEIKYLKVFLNNGKNLFASQFSEKILYNIDKVIIGKLLGNHFVGLFNRAVGINQKIINLFVSIFLSMFNVSFAKFQKDLEKSKLLYNKINWIVYRSCIFSFLIIYCIADEFILFLYGEKWSFTSNLIPFLCFAAVIYPLRNIDRTFLMSNGKFVILRKLQIFELILFVILFLALTRFYGIYGSCLALDIWLIISLILYKSRINSIIKVDFIHFTWPVVCSILIVILNFYLRANGYLNYASGIFFIIFYSIFVSIIFSSLLLLFEWGTFRNIVRK